MRVPPRDRTHRVRRTLVALGVVALASCTRAAPAPPASNAQADATAAPAAGAPVPASVSGFDVVRTFPHDPDAFTQGLIFRDGVLFESTGLNGRSSLRKVRLETGEVLQRRDVDSMYFAEGLTDWNDRLLQLTWTNGIVFDYDLTSFAPRRTLSYRGEGWGLTHDGSRLIMSDGTADLRFLDPETFAETGRVTVRDGDRPVPQLNELEFVRGEVWANVWTTDRIAVIDPSTGQVKTWVDLRGLYRPAGGDDVLNGIAYDAAGDRLFVTGKLWRTLFQIRVRRAGE